jgi:CSLREA domain-containing protein
MSHRVRRKREERRRKHADRRGWGIRHSVITGAGLTAGAVVGLTSPAFGADYTVNNTYDPGDGSCTPGGCTLREAVTYANAHPGPDNIQFQSGLSGTITLGIYGELPITGPTYIYGPGPDVLTVSGNHTSRIFNVDPTTAGNVVFIYGLSMVNGTVTGNGGAIRDQDAVLKIVDSVLSGNTATSGSGGAIYEYGGSNSGYDTRVQFSTLNGNNATANGGAIDARYSFGTIKSSTLTGNAATFGGGAREDRFSKVYDSTIAGNTATTLGGGVYAYHNLYAYNSISANNTAAGFPDVHATHVYGDFNLIENPGSSPLGGSHNITAQDPQLGPLAANGGDSMTMKPAPTSPAVDRGHKDLFAFDQRGLARPFDNSAIANASAGDGTDIGSVELQAGEFPPPASGGAAPQQVPSQSKKCKKKHKRSASAAKKKCKKKKK